MRLVRSVQSGFTFVELIIVTAITVLIFGALLLSFEFAIELNYQTRVKLSALSLANDRMELFRSLPYDDVGVVAGFPAGTIPQNSSFVLNGFTINETVTVEYVDGEGDNVAGVDDNGILQDYKQIKVDYEWDFEGRSSSLSLNSLIVPRSIETNVGGGTIRINVLNADSSLLEGATVRIVGSSSTFPYDVTRTSNVSGAALFSVPADSGYTAIVSGPIGSRQYSTSSTYEATSTNPIPVVAPFSVVEAGVSTLTFQIGELSDLTINAFSSITEASSTEPFADLSGIATSSDVVISADEIELDGGPSSYVPSGEFYLTALAPTPIEQWDAVSIEADVPTDTDYVLRFYTSSSTSYTAIPDGDLPGNITGFSSALIDLSDLDPVAYPEITIGMQLTSLDSSVSPSVDAVTVHWREATAPLTAETVVVRSDKIIGTTASGTSIYKNTAMVTTDGTGSSTLTDLEFDTYTVEPITPYSIASACSEHPFIHEAGVNGLLELIFVARTSTNLRVVVRDGAGVPVPGAAARLELGAYDETQPTNACGQTFFTGGLSDDANYELTVTAPGYTTEVIDPLDVTGETVINVTLSSS